MRWPPGAGKYFSAIKWKIVFLTIIITWTWSIWIWSGGIFIVVLIGYFSGRVSLVHDFYWMKQIIVSYKVQRMYIVRLWMTFISPNWKEKQKQLHCKSELDSAEIQRSFTSFILKYPIIFFSIPPLPSGGTPDTGPYLPLPRQELYPVAASLCAWPRHTMAYIPRVSRVFMKGRCDLRSHLPYLEYYVKLGLRKI